MGPIGCPETSVLYCIVHCSRRLTLQTPVFSRSYLHHQVSPPETLAAKCGTTWARNGRWILSENARLPHNVQGSFTCRKSTTWDRRLYFPPQEGVLRIFSSWKIQRLRSGLNLRTWVPEASTLPLDHRSRYAAPLPYTTGRDNVLLPLRTVGRTSFIARYTALLEKQLTHFLASPRILRTRSFVSAFTKTCTCP